MNQHEGVKRKLEKETEQNEALKQIATELLKNGMAIDQVAKFVNLPLNEIENLRNTEFGK